MKTCPDLLSDLGIIFFLRLSDFVESCIFRKLFRNRKYQGFGVVSGVSGPISSVGLRLAQSSGDNATTSSAEVST